MSKSKILFIYDHEKPEMLEKDGLWSALNILENDFEITRTNLATSGGIPAVDFILGWGAFDSRVDKFLHTLAFKKGLCLAAQFPINATAKNYDVIFYETESVRHWLELEGLTRLVHAFGINTEVYKPMNLPKIWEYITVGSFSNWHRQEKLLNKKGYSLAVGQIQRENLQESLSLVVSCALNGWTIADEVPPEKLAVLYNMCQKAYLPAAFGQERAVLEARACGLPVEIEEDNPKLKELLISPIYDTYYYASQLKYSIIKVLSEGNTR